MPLGSDDVALIERLAAEIVRRRLSAPALFVLESVRPVQFLASQAMVFFAPIAQAVLPMREWGRAQRMLEDKLAIDALVNAIEAQESGQSPGKPGQDEGGVPSGGAR